MTEHGRERAEALALAEKIAAKSSHVVKIGKKAFYEQVQMPLAEAYDYAAQVMTENMMARDANEGICAFIEKRAPQLGRQVASGSATAALWNAVSAST